MTRKDLNHQVRKLAHGVLGLDVEAYRTIVACVYEKSEGHITRCDDEHANLVLLQLQAMVERQRLGGSSTVTKNASAQRKIAKLGFLLGWSWKDIAGFCYKETGKRSTRDCNANELAKVVNGMIRVINYYLEKNRIKMSPEEKAEFERYTVKSKTTEPERSTQ